MRRSGIEICQRISVNIWVTETTRPIISLQVPANFPIYLLASRFNFLKRFVTCSVILIFYFSMKTYYNNHYISKRNTHEDEPTCSYIETTCAEAKNCGKLPLYSALGSETPKFGEGTTPWLAKVYVEGE